MDTILNEQIILKNNNYGIYVGVFPRKDRPGYFYDPYFKVYNHVKKEKASNVARICLLRPEYITSHTLGDVPNYKLSRNEIGFLVKCLNSSTRINGISHERAWDFMCEYITETAKSLCGIYDVNYIGLKMPDYIQLRNQ